MSVERHPTNISWYMGSTTASYSFNASSSMMPEKSVNRESNQKYVKKQSDDHDVSEVQWRSWSAAYEKEKEEKTREINENPAR